MIIITIKLFKCKETIENINHEFVVVFFLVTEAAFREDIKLIEDLQ